jgi:serine/threonine-protein kinase
MTRSAARLFSLLLCLALAACAETGGTISNDEPDPAGKPDTAAPAKLELGMPTGLLIEPVDALKLGYSVDWVTHLNVEEKNDLAYASALGDLFVTVERPQNVVTAISMKTGKQLWRQQAGTTPYRAFAPQRMDNYIVVNTETQLYLFDTTKEGKLANRSDLRSAVVTSAAIVGDMAVFGGADGMVFGHSTRVGYAKWSYKMPGQILVQPQVSGAQVFVAGIDGQYALFAGRTGDKMWDSHTFGAVLAAPAIHPSGIYVACKDHSLYALNRATGEDRWVFRYTDELSESPVVLQNTVYQALPSGEVVALKVTDGAEAWRITTKDKLITQDSRGLIFNGGDKLVVRDAGSGKVIEQVPVKGVLRHVVATPDQSLLVVTAAGRVMKLSPVK